MASIWQTLFLGNLFWVTLIMRKIRNPRFAPEFLERKLSPSDLLGTSASTSVLVCTSTSSPTDPVPSDPPPADPTGPVVPA